MSVSVADIIAWNNSCYYNPFRKKHLIGASLQVEEMRVQNHPDNYPRLVLRNNKYRLFSNYPTTSFINHIYKFT